LERDAGNSYLAAEAVDDDPLNQLLGHSITCRIAVGPQAGRKAWIQRDLWQWLNGRCHDVGAKTTACLQYRYGNLL